MNRKIKNDDELDDLEPANFKMRMDEDPAIHKEIEEERVDKLSQRITLMAIIIPCVIIALIILGYIHINRMVVRFNDTGATTVQNLSKDVETRLTDLTAQLAKLQESHAVELASLSKKVSAQTSGIGKLDTAVKNIQASKAEKKDVQTSLDSTSKSIEQMRKDLAGALAEAQKIATLSQSFSKTDADVKQLKTEKIDKKILDLALESEREKAKKITNGLERDIVSLQAKIVKLERLLEAGNSKSVSQPKPSATPPAAPVKPAAPSSGNIVEQDIN